jgi:hypothetical protein
VNELDRFFVIRDALILERMIAFVRGNWNGLAASDKPLTVHVSEYHAKRSLQQNSAYWALISQIADEAWIDGRQYPRDVWHEYMRERFLPKVEGPHGTYPVSTTSLTMKEFSQYIGKVEAHAAMDLGCDL